MSPTTTRSLARVSSTLALAALVAACGAAGDSGAQDPAAEAVRTPEEVAATNRERYWTSLQSLCGESFGGTVVRDTPANPDSPYAGVDLIMHVRECSPDEIRIPFHVGEDRSRTWVVTRLAEGFRLKHHHLHEDGSPDAVHLYGGDTAGSGSDEWQEFPADPFTAELVPVAATNVWTVEVIPGELFAYGLRREGTDRAFRVEFDLTQSVPTPPAPWGASR